MSNIISHLSVSALLALLVSVPMSLKAGHSFRSFSRKILNERVIRWLVSERASTRQSCVLLAVTKQLFAILMFSSFPWIFRTTLLSMGMVGIVALTWWRAISARKNWLMIIWPIWPITTCLPACPIVRCFVIVSDWRLCRPNAVA